VQHRPDPDAQRRPLVALQPPRGAHGNEDRERREQARDDREQDRLAHADGRDQPEREQRPRDRARIVHRPLEPVRAPVDLGLDDVRQQRVPRRGPQPAREPRPRAQDADLPHRGGGADQRAQDRGRRVAAHRSRPAAARVVRERAAGQLRGARDPVGDALDRAERRRRRAERRRQQRGQERGRHLVADVREEARDADPGDAAIQPARMHAAL
jgi:hypothetical protein